MTSFISFKVVQFYTFTCLIELFRTENLRVSGKQRRRQHNFKSTCCPLHCRIEKIVTHLPLNSNKMPLRHDSFDAICLRLLRDLGGGGGAGYGISMGLEYFKNFLLNLCKGRVILEGINTF